MTSGHKTQVYFNLKGCFDTSNFGHKREVIVKLCGRK